MLVRLAVPPGVAAVGPYMRPRLWATAWSLGFAGGRQAPSTIHTDLRHLDKLYEFCDDEFGVDSLDEAISTGNASAAQLMMDAFYLELTSGTYTNTQVKCWKTSCGFVSSIALQRAAGSDKAWMALAAYLRAVRKMRRPDTSRFKFIRALPDLALKALVEVAHPDSSTNPLKSESGRLRAWLIINLLLLCGLRRGELLILAVDALKHDLDPETGQVRHWLNVTTSDDDDDTRATRPSIKTVQSHRQVPISASLADLYQSYVSDARVGGNHSYLVTSRSGEPLSVESVTKIMQRLTAAMDPKAVAGFRERSGKRHVSPHDLRHTCATARYSMFMAADSNRALALQRMRAFFGWSVSSEMPEIYARAAIQDDLLRTWNDLFDRRIELLRSSNRHGN